MPALKRLAVILVAVLVVVGIGVAAVTLADGDGTAAASPTATTTATAQPSLEVPDDVLAALQRIEQQVVQIRGLPAADIGPPELITRAQLADELQRIFDEEYPPEARERDTTTLRALGLLGPDDDLAALQLQLLGDQVLGFYSQVDQRMVVVTDAGLDAEARITYAHEYTHALQDAAFGLDSLETDAVGEDDRSLARTALIEGDATLVMFAWAVGNLTAQELLEMGTNIELPDTTGIPSWMSAQLEFPYSAGLDWTSTLVGSPLQPDFTQVNAAFTDPPDSTEQVMHFGKWMPREDPVAVEAAADLAAALGDGWEEVSATTMGEAIIGFALEYHGVGHAAALAAAQGWGGDRVTVVDGPGDDFALVWRLAWDSPADASEFADAYRSTLDALGFPASVTETSASTTLVVHASSEDLLRRATEAAVLH